MRFGRQRSPGDVATLVLLFVGFTALAIAFWVLTLTWFGLLLPIGYLIGVYATLRAEVKEIELRGDTLVLRTFFRAYPIPRAHVTKVIRTPRGASIAVLNGNQYEVTPVGTDADEVAHALETWLLQGPDSGYTP
jgi:hypothetical protein